MGNCPAILLIPEAGDDQVVFAHNFEFLEEVQYYHPNNPMPLHIYLFNAIGQEETGQSADSLTSEAVHQKCISELALGLERLK